ncbi:hypothetical protein ZTR_05943 [Talaromyces verruculosus]|nr:hypothetical protein ZTR_05943 [Talaromyces verruculosus]
MLFRLMTMIIALMQPLITRAVPDLARDQTTYCGAGKIVISDAERLTLFQAYNIELHVQKNVSGAFAKYVSPNLLEHTASADGYNQLISSLSASLPNVNITFIENLIVCGTSVANQPVCTLHYKVEPLNRNAGIDNTTVTSSGGSAATAQKEEWLKNIINPADGLSNYSEYYMSCTWFEYGPPANSIDYHVFYGQGSTVVNETIANTEIGSA